MERPRAAIWVFSSAMAGSSGVDMVLMGLEE